MSRFYLVNEKRYPLPVHTALPGSNGESCNVDLLPFYRWEHRVTLGHNGKRYMVFLDNLLNKAYIEEDTSNGIQKIKDENLAKALGKFATSKGYLMVMPPMMKNKEERFV